MESSGLNFYDAAVWTIDPLQVGNAQLEEDIVMEHPYIVAAQIQHLSGWSYARWNSFLIPEEQL